MNRQSLLGSDLTKGMGAIDKLIHDEVKYMKGFMRKIAWLDWIGSKN